MNDIAAVMAVLRTPRLYLVTEISCPDDLVCGILDLFALKEVDTIFIARKIDDVVVLLL